MQKHDDAFPFVSAMFPAGFAWRFQGIGRGCLLAFFAIVLVFALESPVFAFDLWTGDRIVEEAFKRHDQYPYVFENQTMVLKDKNGEYNTRKLRRFSRMEKDGTIKFLLVLDDPVEVRGVALLSIVHPKGVNDSGVYLPAFGKEMKSSVGETRGSYFLDTDFTVGDLMLEVMKDFRYVRAADFRIDKNDYFVVDAFPTSEEVERATGYSMRKLFVRQDNFYIVRTDYYDRHGRLSKQQTNHDLKRVNGDMWRANMILMEDFRKRHQTLIKINRRVFSHDYVLPEMFTTAWLFGNKHVLSSDRRLAQNIVKTGDEKTAVSTTLNDSKTNSGEAEASEE